MPANPTIPGSCEDGPANENDPHEWAHYDMAKRISKMEENQLRVEEVIERELLSISKQLASVTTQQESTIRGQRDHIRRLEARDIIHRKTNGRKLPGVLGVGIQYAVAILEQMIQEADPQSAMGLEAGIAKLKRLAQGTNL